METDSNLATGFRDADKNGDIVRLVACLQFMNDLPSFAAYKSRSFDRMHLKPGDVAVDLGCGLGFDVRRIADRVLPGGLAVGVDSSEKLLEAANRAFFQKDSLEFRKGDIHDLAIDSGSIDSIRADRVLQHVENPGKVISEMVRVLKPGGWLVCAEPDWSTFVVDSDDIETANLVAGRWRRSFRNPSLGRQLLRRVQTEGMRHAWVEGFVLLANGLDAVNTVYDISKTVELLEREDGGLKERLSGWFEDLEKSDKVSTVTASVTLFLAGGQKPV